MALIASVRDTPRCSSLGDLDLAFAHLCLSDPGYREYFARAAASGRTVILDNGIMELGHSFDEQGLVEAVRHVAPTFVTPPERLGDGWGTIELTREFIGHLPQLRLPLQTSILGVAHGKGWEEWLACYRILHDELPTVTLIGIPYDMTFDVPGAAPREDEGVYELMMRRRIAAVQQLVREGLDRKPVHLLGIVDAIELRVQAQHRFVVSNDSSTAYVSAQFGERYDLETGIGARKKKIDMRSSLPSTAVADFHHNVDVIRQLARRPA
ncbi:MAG TPA: hypothetical protein VMS98_11160 [Thermoanaerobaculia bacterium]|nr:hypothetical protein [Thermoanaerobaculia bacterium]